MRVRRVAGRTSWSPALPSDRPRLVSGRRERARVEVGADRGNLAVPNRVPVGHGRSGDLRVEDVKDGNLLAFGDRLLLFDALHDAGEVLDRRNVVVGTAECIDRAVEAQIVVQQTPRSGEV